MLKESAQQSAPKDVFATAAAKRKEFFNKRLKELQEERNRPRSFHLQSAIDILKATMTKDMLICRMEREFYSKFFRMLPRDEPLIAGTFLHILLLAAIRRCSDSFTLSNTEFGAGLWKHRDYIEGTLYVSSNYICFSVFPLVELESHKMRRAQQCETAESEESKLSSKPEPRVGLTCLKIVLGLKRICGVTLMDKRLLQLDLGEKKVRFYLI